MASDLTFICWHIHFVAFLLSVNIYTSIVISHRAKMDSNLILKNFVGRYSIINDIIKSSSLDMLAWVVFYFGCK